ncbi:MAG: isoprenylcysteine carboxylmethyltransferase family protein [Candidatus Omnitrophota bacterium]
MKQRIKIDGTIMLLAIALTGFLYFFSILYTQNVFWDNVFNFLGLIFILKGTYLRMAARGYKKEFSQKGQDLVVDGLYTLTRNPMYLGTYLIGAGFVLIVWPWWFLVIFSALFFVRFNQQMVKEEAHLKKLFGAKYEKYCKETPRFFPALKSLIQLKVAKVFPWKMCWSTKERLGLLGWPILAFFLEIFQRYVIFHVVDITSVLYLFISAILVFAIALVLRYRFNL